MADLAKIKRNVAKMVSMDAPEADIDAYIASEGVSVDTVRLFDPTRDKQASQQERGSFMDPVRQGISFGFADELDGIQSGFNHLVQGKNPVEGFHAGVEKSRSDLRHSVSVIL